MRFMFICAPILLAFIAPANASHRHHHRHYSSHHHLHVRLASREAFSRHVELPHPAGCPRTEFCGCGASNEIFGHPIHSLFLAAAWFRFPRAAPAPGMVAVRQHHVMVIRQPLGSGRALVYNANGGGHRTYLAVRSLAGFSIRNPRL